MAHLISNAALANIAGKVGDLVFVHCADGRTLVRRRPRRRTHFTGPELQTQSGFARAVAYVHKLKANPEAYAAYKAMARVARKRACDLAMADFLNPPEITDIDLRAYSGRAGQSLLIEAMDRTEVRSVAVVITDGNDVLLEQGPALLQSPPGKWVYATQHDVAAGQLMLIHITAADRAGNTVTRSVFYSIPASP